VFPLMTLFWLTIRGYWNKVNTSGVSIRLFLNSIC
jgi:hypothetical protein